MTSPLRFRVLEHPLAQIEAAAKFHDQIHAHVADEWGDLYSDDPPTEDTLAQTIHPRNCNTRMKNRRTWGEQGTLILNAHSLRPQGLSAREDDSLKI